MNFDDMSGRFDTIPECHGQTDERKDGIAIYDTIRQKSYNVNSKAECDQPNLAHVARKKYKKGTKRNIRQCPLSSV